MIFNNNIENKIDFDNSESTNKDIIISEDLKKEISSNDNDDISDKDKKTKIKKEKRYYTFFKNYSSNNHPFDFKSYKSVDGILFFVLAILLPFVINIFITYNYPKSHSSPIDSNKDQAYLSQRLMLEIFGWLVSGVVLIYLWIKYGKKFIKNGGIIPFYMFLFMPIMTTVLQSLFQMTLIYKKGSDSLQTILSTWAQMIAELICIVLILTTTKGLFKRIINTYKDSTFIVIVPIAIAALYLTTIIFNFLQKSLGILLTSDNQTELDDLKKSIGGIITLGIFTLLIAPVIEEITTRHGIFTMTSNKWLGLAASTIYFAGMHVSDYGDWNDILDYLAASIVLASTFLICNGNVAFTIAVHMIINTITFAVSFNN